MQLIENFISNPALLLQQLMADIVWDERMKNRKTASFGKAYNYSQMTYPEQPMLLALLSLIPRIKGILGFEPNNCLINYYPNGNSRMGWHADETESMQEGTGVVIISLGAERELHFRRIEDKNDRKLFSLKAGSLFYMNQEVQSLWQHSIPKATDLDQARLSLTFRALK
jgi:alkylated DNA repair dioxygenase AlkB